MPDNQGPVVDAAANRRSGWLSYSWRRTEDAPDGVAWRVALAKGAIAYVLSRFMVLAAAGVVAAARNPRPTSARGPMLDVLTSWDGAWYLELVRRGYPISVIPDVTFFDLDARAAFFPLYPMVVRGLDVVLPAGDVFAALFVNAVLGAVFVYLVGLVTRRIAGPGRAGRAMILVSLFPGAYVLSFAYSEALMLSLAALALLLLLDERWLAAGLVAGLATATRPNAVALVAAALVAAYLAWHRHRTWQAWVAPLFAPAGLVVFQVWLSIHAGEALVWLRVQREAWDEGVSFGWSAVSDAIGFLTDPFTSATNALTFLTVVGTAVGVYLLWRARLPAPLVAYSAVVLGLMLLPATVTARPRFLLTAFPLLIAAAVVWPDEHEEGWAFLLCICGAGLVATTGLYGLYAAIP